MDAENLLIFDLVRSMTVGVLMFDPTKRIVLANPMVRTITGIYREDATFGDFISVFQDEEELRRPEGGRIDLVSAADQVLEQNKIVKFESAAFRHKFFEIVVTPIRDQKRHLRGGTVIFHDITRIKEIDDLKTEFVTIASHQLRTPLTAMRLYAEMLLEGHAGALHGKQHEYMEAMYVSTNRMITLVNDLLNISRIESEKYKIAPTPTQLEQFIEQLITESKILTDTKKCRVTFTKPHPPLPEVAVDQKVLRQIFTNLLSNAVRYSETGACHIEVSVRERGANYEMRVSDEGIGIPENVRGRVFERFFRASNAVSLEAQGTGMGLYIVKTLVEAAGGRVWFESRSGRGTSFFVLIPKSGMILKQGEKELV